jgi:hypothetical protein
VVHGGETWIGREVVVQGIREGRAGMGLSLGWSMR